MDHVMNIARDLVSRGAARLDERRSDDWRKIIDVGRLNLRTIDDCVLGQLYGSYGEGLTALGLCVGTVNGFSSDGVVTDLALQLAWEEYLTK